MARLIIFGEPGDQRKWVKCAIGSAWDAGTWDWGRPSARSPRQSS